MRREKRSGGGVRDGLWFYWPAECPGNQSSGTALNVGTGIGEGRSRKEGEGKGLDELLTHRTGILKR